MAPLQGYVTLSEDKMTASFSCEPGYTLSGHNILTCLGDGNGWNYDLPTCSKLFIFHRALDVEVMIKNVESPKK